MLTVHKFNGLPHWTVICVSYYYYKVFVMSLSCDWVLLKVHKLNGLPHWTLICVSSNDYVYFHVETEHLSNNSGLNRSVCNLRSLSILAITIDAKIVAGLGDLMEEGIWGKDLI